MRTAIKWLVILAALGSAGFFGYAPIRDYLKRRNAPKWRDAEVTRGDLVLVVNATGTVQPVQRVLVGSFASGPIQKLHVDFNDRVKKGDLLAEIDPKIYEAIKARDEAAVASAEADVDRVQALLDQAKHDYDRAKSLRDEDPKFMSEMEEDKYEYAWKALKAQLVAAEAAVKRAKADLKNSETNLGYTKISSPVDGIVIERKVDEGQTVAAQFQVPDMFTVAPRMEEEMYVYANVDEADIGLIRRAQKGGQSVYFTVDAYPEDIFEGKIHDVRLNPQTTQNVVTYPVVVTCANPDLKLLPGMTADLSFQVEQRDDVVRVPNAALRFYPKAEHVHPDDKPLVEGTDRGDEDEAEETADERSAMQRYLARRDSSKRHVWCLDGEMLRAVEITTGINDYEYTEVVAGDLEPGKELITGMK